MPSGRSCPPHKPGEPDSTRRRFCLDCGKKVYDPIKYDRVFGRSLDIPF